MDLDLNQLLLASALTLLAGVSTAIGAVIAFFARRENIRMLGFGLGFSAGVMIYISLVELLPLSLADLARYFHSRWGELLGLALFFGGIIITAIIDKLIPEDVNPHEPRPNYDELKICPLVQRHEALRGGKNIFSKEEDAGRELGGAGGIPAARSSLALAAAVAGFDEARSGVAGRTPANCAIKAPVGVVANLQAGSGGTLGLGGAVGAAGVGKGSSDGVGGSTLGLGGAAGKGPPLPRAQALKRTGIFTALAIAIHNFPEGFATFISSVNDLSLGLVIALAIAIHNIPEGLAVSLPIYHATGDKRRAFIYSTLSGLAEPLGALVGALLILPFIGELSLAVSFALIAGIMIFISFDELLPAARIYGHAHDSLYGLFLGMGVMALSLVLLK